MDDASSFPMGFKEAANGRQAKVPWSAVAVFVVAAYLFGWLLALPMWFSNEVTTTRLMMFAPALAVIVVLVVMKQPRRDVLRYLGLWPLRPAKRILWWIAISAIGPVLVVFATVAVSVAFGWLRLDLEGLAGLEALVGEDAFESVQRLGSGAAWVLIISFPIGALQNTLYTLGEEIGWRGWLLPALRPLGTYPALVLTGAIWGVWHMPVTLLGHNFYLPDWRGVALVTIGSIAWGIVIGWIRLRTGSVWPAAVAHGAMLSSGSSALLFRAPGAEPSMVLVNPLGVSGWIVLGLLIVGLHLAGQFKKQPDLAPPRSKTRAATNPSD